MISELLSATLYGAGAFLAALAALSVFWSHQRSNVDRAPNALVYLVREDRLVDANPAGQLVLDDIDGPLDPMVKLKTFLSNHFENASTILENAQPESKEYKSFDQQTKMDIEAKGNSVRLQISTNAATSEVADVHSLKALKSELNTLRANARAAPFLLWRQNTEGEITWVNQAYLDVLDSALGEDKKTNWPVPALFPNLQSSVNKTSRLSLRTSDKSETWYDCHVAAVGTDLLCTAFKADEAVRSENRRREFTQTLTKTFAELAIGLAIFDRSRSLVLFNPALLDLTSLPTDFLAARPSMVTFLDRLRENRVMPEPRDYRTWRKKIAELEAAAVDGTYSETWSLPDGHTYHVTGRPHPDGAVALLFEDISAEMSLTRRFRAELEQSQSVIDALEDGVAVFSATGQLTQTNKASSDLWRLTDDSKLVGSDVNDVTRRWHTLSFPTPVWGDFRDFVHRSHDREEWQSNVSLRDGRSVLCRFIPQKGGPTLAVFRLVVSDRAPQEGMQKAV
ncbi:MAG: PAS-domain containing protein [Paracoccaceae bacterium]